MGQATSTGQGSKAVADAADRAILFSFPQRLDQHKAMIESLCPSALSTYCVVPADHPARKTAADAVYSGQFPTPAHDFAMGAIVGLVVGDALGAPLEFRPVDYKSHVRKGLDSNDCWTKPGFNRFGLEPGQWTDDASMSLCLADSLLVNQRFNPRDLRVQFLNWWSFGLNNAFKDSGRPSVGLGGNISQSFEEFLDQRTEYTKAGDLKTSGNGSAMRLAPAPVYYAKDNDVEQAMAVSARQSKTTHQGDEAAECCRLMAFLMLHLIHHTGTGKSKKDVLASALDLGFESPLYSVTCLASSQQEDRHPENDGLDLADRNWNWKSKHFRYSPNREKEMPGYMGSYVMDGLSMALHCVWTTDSFKDALLKAANLCGDADTVAAITGQLAGALYGVSHIPRPWIDAVERWDTDHSILARAWLLYTHEPL